MGSTLYFSADDGIHGRELWNLDAEALPAPCLATPDRLCLLNGGFEVEALWRDFQGRGGRGIGHFISQSAGSFGFVEVGGAEVMVKLVDVCVAAGLAETWAYVAGVTNLERSSRSATPDRASVTSGRARSASRSRCVPRC